MVARKRVRLSYSNEEKSDPFEKLPDDLVITIFTKLSSSSSCPSDFFNALTVCKRFHLLGLNQLVLSNTCSGVFAMKANKWCDSASRFFKLCAHAGSPDACYFLGMIQFYCMGFRGSGTSLMAKAAVKAHAPALYSLAVIQFNGSGGLKCHKDLRAGVALCARAAYLGHVDALRELGHCLQDGYGIKQNIAEGRRLLVQANARELASVLPSVKLLHIPAACGVKTMSFQGDKKVSGLLESGSCSLLRDLGCNLPAPEPHPANRFLVEWYTVRETCPGLRLCSHAGCGRPETRSHEFRRCSVCGTVNYCSRGCQALDWKLRHKGQCTRVGLDNWVNVDPNGAGPEFGMVGAQQDDHHQVGS